MYSLKSWKFVQVLLSFTVEWLLRNNTLVQRKMLSFKRRCRSGQTRGTYQAKPGVLIAARQH